MDNVLRERYANGGQGSAGVKAIVVYPMNALANSQLLELEKFLKFGYPTDGDPVRFGRYTGQEGKEIRRQILADPPDILLTNYVMLELVLTRPDERKHLILAAQGLRFLVLDEMHTYRGRQVVGVALLVRRLRNVCASPNLQVIGTSATMASRGVGRHGATAFIPRQDADASGGDSVTGYIYVSEDLPWPANPIVARRFPDHWLETSEAGEISVIHTKRRTYRGDLAGSRWQPRLAWSRSSMLVRIHAVRVLHSMPGVLRTGPQRRRQARHT